METFQTRSYINSLETVRGQSIGLVASLFDNENNAAFAGNIRESSVRIETPNGQIVRAKMFDDGNHNDAAADDGIFSGAFVPTQAGKFVAQITAKGITPNGESFIRTGEHIVDVAANRAVFDSNAFAKSIDDMRLRIHLPVRNGNCA